MKWPALVGAVVASLMLAGGYAPAGIWVGALSAIGVGGVWLVGLWLNLALVNSGGLFAVAALAALGVYLQLPPIWPLLSVAGALAAWDLAEFAQRLAEIEEPFPGRSALKLAHRQRLALVIGLGLALGGLALTIQLPLRFGWAALLGLLLAVGLSWIMRVARQG